MTPEQQSCSGAAICPINLTQKSQRLLHMDAHSPVVHGMHTGRPSVVLLQLGPQRNARRTATCPRWALSVLQPISFTVFLTCDYAGHDRRHTFVLMC